MDFSTFMPLIKDNPIFAGAAGVLLLILIYLIYLRPKQFIMIVLLAALLGGVYYMITSVASIGTSQKAKAIQRSTGP